MKVFLLIYALIFSSLNFAADFLNIKAPPSTTIMSYINKNQAEELEDYLLELDRLEIDKIFNERYFILHRALRISTIDKDIIEILLKYGANPNIGISNNWNCYEYNLGIFYTGWTAAHIAIKAQQRKEILDLLRQYGCDFSQNDDGGWSALDLAGYLGQTATVKYLKKPRIKPEKTKNVISSIFDEIHPVEMGLLLTGATLGLTFYYLLHHLGLPSPDLL